jgi:hypothetical protein
MAARDQALLVEFARQLAGQAPELLPRMTQMIEGLVDRYDTAGAPYGDSIDGMLRWGAEQWEKVRTEQLA